MNEMRSVTRRLILGVGIAATMAVTAMTAGVDAKSYGPQDFEVVVDPVVREDDCGQQYPAPGSCAPRPDLNP